jgi:hypothetical protein
MAGASNLAWRSMAAASAISSESRSRMRGGRLGLVREDGHPLGGLDKIGQDTADRFG